MSNSADNLYNQMVAMSKQYPTQSMPPRPQISLERVAAILDEVVARVSRMEDKIFALETENEILKEAIEELDR